MVDSFADTRLPLT